MAIYSSSLRLKYRAYVTVPVSKDGKNKVIRKDWLPKYEKDGWKACGPASDADPGQPKESEGLTNSLLGAKSENAAPVEGDAAQKSPEAEVPEVQKKVRDRKKRVKKKEG